jgi:hypothetical protein
MGPVMDFEMPTRMHAHQVGGRLLPPPGVYRDRRAFEEHEAQPHIRRFLAEREQHLAGVEVTFLTPVAAKGLDLATPST